MTPSEGIEDLVLWERTKLPAEHPRKPSFGGYLIDKVRTDGQRAYLGLAGAKRLPDAADLEAMVNGELYVTVYCVRREAEREHEALRAELATVASRATAEALRRALDALKGDA